MSANVFTLSELEDWKRELHRQYRLLDDDDYLGEPGETIRVCLRQLRKELLEQHHAVLETTFYQ